MKKEIAKFIENERELSRYKISILSSKDSLTPSRRRLVEIEEEFLSIPFEKFKFQTVQECNEAIKLYRESRRKFYEQYSVEKSKISLDRKNLLVAKINCLAGFKDSLKKKCLSETNLVQSNFFFKKASTLLPKYNLHELELNELEKLEPAILAKERARYQVLLFCVYSYINQNLSYLEDIDLSGVDFLSLNKRIDDIVDNLHQEIFSFYNYGLELLPNLTKDGFAKNRYLGKLHKLNDLCSFSTKDLNARPIGNVNNFNFSRPQLGYLLLGKKQFIQTNIESDLVKKIKNKVLGIPFPLPHCGNEKLSLLYKNITINGIDLSNLFEQNFSNILLEESDGTEVYYKALMIKPFWEINSIVNNEQLRIILEILNIPTVNEKVYNPQFLNLDKESKILVPKTRSEDYGLQAALETLDVDLAKLDEELAHICATTNDIF